ncbi:UDP-glucuronosyltransferase 3A1-like [Carcharodon carcharias]|uniref:UDP-glucuronosyltransferase 3A1-like n=1 Tax=Carcharodon carcharias TaxID=13397 RepID=UPI001B7F5DDF|nr:UDP-glucuronosyltransferase 3A1-like [Carcharodon carcharias]
MVVKGRLLQMVFVFVFLAPTESAKILTIALIGGSHYLLFDEVSHLLHKSGHDVNMLVQIGNPQIKGINYVGRNNSYRVTAWSADDEYLSSYNKWFLEQQSLFLQGRFRVKLLNMTIYPRYNTGSTSPASSCSQKKSGFSKRGSIFNDLKGTIGFI